ncbi:PhzF family phenazine biosynthesis protein [Paraburkholderia metrosideri]|uniref:PhzF family phenazine biosynthesis protein n=1 Tax=Paraburkholderia metrosideri TaxID=580937 RepID=A0ABW9E365_9BURK
MDLQFKRVDVFAERPFMGNPVIVIFDAIHLDDEHMRQIAGSAMLSQTTFILPATLQTADYRVRTFSPERELPFTRHATIGTAHALLEAGLVRAKNGHLTQECSAGRVRIDVSNGESTQRIVSVALPEVRFKTPPDAWIVELQRLLGDSLARGAPVKLLDVGTKWIVAQLKDAQTIRALEHNHALISNLAIRLGSAHFALFGCYDEGSSDNVEVRTYAQGHSAPECPVSENGMASVAAYIQRHGLDLALGPSFVSCVKSGGGQHARVHVDIAPGGTIRIGGNSVTSADGCIYVT